MELLNAFKNNKIIKIDDFITPESNWEDFVPIINYAYKLPVNWSMTPINDTFTPIGNIKFYDKLTMVVSEVHCAGLKDVESVNHILSLTDMSYRGAVATISFTDSEKTTRKHSDQISVLYVQCIGSVKWQIWIDEEICEEYTLNPGDAIFVPKKTYHEVISLTPRVGITFAISSK
jgi:mannose-6-phosphate isomerase-like protein (cupin superfamily)